MSDHFIYLTLYLYFSILIRVNPYLCVFWKYLVLWRSSNYACREITQIKFLNYANISIKKISSEFLTEKNREWSEEENNERVQKEISKSIKRKERWSKNFFQKLTKQRETNKEGIATNTASEKKNQLYQKWQNKTKRHGLRRIALFCFYFSICICCFRELVCIFCLFILSLYLINFSF